MKNILILFICFYSFCANSQQTVGVFTYTDETYEGYTFFSPMRSHDAFLIDNCGRLVKKWDRNNRPGLSGYLADNGVMLRTNKVNSPSFNQASTGGNIELVDWNNNTIWSSDFNQSEFIQHHDAKLLPNGNIIFIGWERISTEEQLELGRDVNALSSPYLWGEFIWEIKPIGTSNYDIIWEWHLKDHFVQEIYPEKSTYGLVEENIGKVDINYLGPGAWDDDDWWHCNAIDYNQDLDQILLNSRNNNELWIIDHSTSSEQAAGSTGGNSGKGGELLFRWGNPQAYDAGSSADLRMYGSHGHYWIPEGLPNAGKIMYFNNGDSRPQGYYSTVEMIDPIEVGSNYEKNTQDRYLPVEPQVVYQAQGDPFDFLSYFLSNAQQLPNGNVFINEGGDGRLFEVNENSEIVWEYISPVRSSGPVIQGSFPSSNDIFRAYKLGPEFSGFDGLELISGELLEGPNEFEVCLEIATEDSFLESPVSILQTQNVLELSSLVSFKVNYQLRSTSGGIVLAGTLLNNVELNIQDLDQGIYFLTLIGQNGKLWTNKILKY